MSLAKRFLQWYSPKLYKRLTKITVRERAASKELRWLGDNLKDMVIGRNSDFHTEELSDEQLEELGGIELVTFYSECSMMIANISYFVQVPCFAASELYCHTGEFIQHKGFMCGASLKC